MIEYTTDNRNDDNDEKAKRSPAVEYGYDKKESPYAGCVDCYQIFERMYAMCGKEI